MTYKGAIKEHLSHFLLSAILVSSFFWGIKENAAHSNRDSILIEDLTEALREQFRSRQLDSARVLVGAIKQIAREADMPLKLADSEANYGLIERVSNNHQAAIAHYRTAARLYEYLDERASAARAYTAIGQIQISNQLYEPAYQAFSQSFQLRKKERDSLGMANNLVNMAGAAYYGGRLDVATDYYYRGLRIADRIQNLPLRAQITMNVANVHMRKENHDLATNYLEQALQLRREQGDRQGESEVLLNLGITAYKKGMLDKADENYTESLEIKEDMGTDIAGIVKLIHNMGLVSRERGDNTRAIIQYNKALEMARQINDVQTQAAILNNIGVIMLIEGNDEALPLFQESLNISRMLQLRKLELSNYDNLHQYYAGKGNYEKAYDHLTRYQQLNDSLNRADIASRIAELQTVYDTEITEQENLLLTEQSNVLRLRLIMVSISAMSIAFLAIAFFILFNLKRKSLRQNTALLTSQQELSRIAHEKSLQEQQHLKEVLVAEEEINRMQKSQLQQKNRELASSALLIIKKNEVLNNMRIMALQALKSDSCDGIACIKKLIREIDDNVKLDEQWEFFQRHFEAVHPGFFSRLGKEYPGLTHNELKFCAYLRINLSSKEIAQILNISTESAITKRYRIRKKMNLPNEENLNDFLMQF